jgi:pimeloyl-ACP methyl ester carboxylesterase
MRSLRDASNFVAKTVARRPWQNARDRDAVDPSVFRVSGNCLPWCILYDQQTGGLNMTNPLLTRLFTLFLCLFGLSFSTAAQRTIEGHWEGTLIREGAKLPVSFDIAKDGDGLRVSFNSLTQRAIGIPVRNVSYKAPALHMELVGDTTTIVFDGELNADTITGQFRENDGKGTFALRRVAPKPPSFREEEVSFRNKDVTLAGTLFLPLTGGPHPAVVFLHGAGPEGRYASRFLAEQLANRGIAALIYDKRGVGKSTGDWKGSDFNDLASDAIAGIELLKQRNEIKAKKIGIYGHSQGGMICPLVASRSKDVSFIVSGAGSAVPVYESEINSVTNQLKANGISGAELAEATEFIKLWVNVMRTGEGWPEFDKAIEKVRDRKWYPMLHMPPKDNWIWAFHKRIYDYNSADYWATVGVPALIIYGERDLYVPVAQSILNIDRALNKAANRDYTILVLPRASHAFTVEPEPGQPFEWPHLSSGFPDLLTAWINQRVK